jgi:hypothetical protein
VVPDRFESRKRQERNGHRHRKANLGLKKGTNERKETLPELRRKERIWSRRGTKTRGFKA